MSLIDNVEQVVEVKIYYKETKNKHGITTIKVISDDKLVKEDNTIHLLVTRWKKISWKDDNDVIKESTISNMMTGASEFNPFMYRDRKIKKCLIGWDLKDDSNNPVPFSVELIDKMPSDIVYALLNKYEKMTSLDEEEEKK